MKKPKKIILKREFLNLIDHHSIALALLKIKFCEEYNYMPIDGHLIISDCTNNITLQLECKNEKELDNSIYKLKTLSDICLTGAKELEKMRKKLILWEIKEKEKKRK